MARTSVWSSFGARLRRRAAAWIALSQLGWGTSIQAETPLHDCRVAGIAHSVRCGAVRRALDPHRPDGAMIDVHYVVVPALARRKLPDPVFLLAGGPGQSAVSLAGTTLGLLQRLSNRRDLVFVDQRGTGSSAPLQCEEAPRAPLAERLDSEHQLQRLEVCRRSLQALPHGDLRFYTTTLAMQDLDAVRTQLAAERINLVGVSYGTRAALEYQRQFPQRVRRMVLDGVAPPDMVLPASGSLDAQAALDAMFTACAAQPECAAAFPELRRNWDALLASLPRRVEVPHPLSGETESLTLTREIVLGAVRSPLYSPALAAALPAAISQAAYGRPTALLGLAAPLSLRQASRIAEGMHFSVLCSEDIPLLAAAAPPQQRATDFGDWAARAVQRVCADWPRGAVSTSFYKVTTSASPVLLLSGGLDPATPPRHAERVRDSLGTNARHVVLANAGHGVLGVGCMRDVVFRFIDARDDPAALQVDASCAAMIPRPGAFRPAAVQPARASAR